MKKTIKKLIDIDNIKFLRSFFLYKNKNISNNKKIRIIKLCIKFNLLNLFQDLINTINFNIDKNKRLILSLFNTSIKYKNKKIFDLFFYEKFNNSELKRGNLYNFLSISITENCIKKENTFMFDYFLFENYYLKTNYTLLYHFLIKSLKNENYIIFRKTIKHYIKLRKGNIRVIFSEDNYFHKAIKEKNISILNILLEEIDFNINKKDLISSCLLDFDIKCNIDLNIWYIIFNHKNTKNILNQLIKEDEIFFRVQDLYKYYKQNKIKYNITNF